VWLVAGTVVYFGYGIRHSKLNMDLLPADSLSDASISLLTNKKWLPLKYHHLETDHNVVSSHKTRERTADNYDMILPLSWILFPQKNVWGNSQQHKNIAYPYTLTVLPVKIIKWSVVVKLGKKNGPAECNKESHCL